MQVTIGKVVEAEVVRHEPYGVFVKMTGVDAIGLVSITNFKDHERMTPAEDPPIGTFIRAVVLGFRDRPTEEVWLSMKPSHLVSGFRPT